MTSRFTTRSLVVVAAAAAFGLAACSSGSSGDSGGAGGGSGATSGGAAAAGVTLIASGKITTCTHLPYAPFQSNDDQGKTIGFDVDMIDLVAEKLGVEQAIVDTPFEGIKSGQDLSTGKCDIAAAGMTITDERKKVILFSRAVLRRHPGAAGARRTRTVATLADLKGKKLGAQTATTGLDYAQGQGGRERLRDRRVPGPRLAAPGPDHRPGRRRGQRPPGLDRGRQGATRARSRSPPSSTPVSSTASA